MLLYDTNNLAIRILFAIPEIYNGGDVNWKFWKFVFFDKIYKSMFYKDFRNQSNKVVLAVDANTNWRKLTWKRYKENRKISRDKADFDWSIFFNEYTNFLNEIKDYIPFMVMKCEYCEADDIIAVLGKQYGGIVISTDEDFKQLTSNNNIKLFNPTMKKFIKLNENEVEEFIKMKSLNGQKKDFILNVETPLDIDIEKDKMKRFGENKAKKIINNGFNEYLGDINSEKHKHYLMNRKLIDFNEIPSEISEFILKKYNKYKIPNPNNLYTFFENNGWKWYLDNYNLVENKMLQLFGNLNYEKK